MASFGMQPIKGFSEFSELSRKYSIPLSEIVQIDFNRMGIYLPNNEIKANFRVRFKGSILDGDNSWFALPVREVSGSYFRAVASKIYFGEREIGKFEELMLDTCESSYQRGPQLLNLNSRSRSTCGGCTACVHNYKNLYDDTVIKDRQVLITADDVRNFLFTHKINVPSLKQIAIVTGLFGSEEHAVEHIGLVHSVVKEFGFSGELMYFGCEINSRWAIRRLAEIDNFLLIYALDNFTKRERLLAKTKSRVTLDDARNVLTYARNLGLKTTIAYIAGIDPLEEMRAGFCRILDSLSHFPIINIYQVQTPGQAKIFDPEATNLEYFLKSRIMIEEMFKSTTMRPKRWENYRPLWYGYFQDRRLPANSYGENE